MPDGSSQEVPQTPSAAESKTTPSSILGVGRSGVPPEIEHLTKPPVRDINAASPTGEGPDSTVSPFSSGDEGPGEGESVADYQNRMVDRFKVNEKDVPTFKDALARRYELSKTGAQSPSTETPPSPDSGQRKPNS